MVGEVGMGTEARRLLAVGVVVFVLWLLVGGGLLQALGYLLGLFVVVGILSVCVADRLRQDAPVDIARRVQNLAEITNFTDAAIAVRANVTLSAQEKLEELAFEYSESLQRLNAGGHLTRPVALEFRIFAERNAQAITGL